MGYFGDEMTRGGFVSHMTKYIEQLMKNPSSAKVDDYLANHGITTEKALEMLLKKPDKNNEESAILIRKERIRTGEDGKDVFSVTYKLPERDKFRQKMRNLYINVFESNIIPGCPINELNQHEMPLSATPSPFKSGIKVVSQCPPGSTGDRWAKYVNDNDNVYTPKMFTDEDKMVKDIEEMDKDGKYAKCGGLDKKVVNETADSAFTLQDGGNNFEAGELSLPVNKKPITRTFNEGKKRTVFMTEDQVRYIKKVMDEATASVSDTTPASELAYPVFTGDKNFAGKTLDHSNICADPELMKGAKEK